MKLLCRIFGCNWDTDDLHSQLSAVCQSMEPVPLTCSRCGKPAWAKWERGKGMSLLKEAPVIQTLPPIKTLPVPDKTQKNTTES